MTTITWQVCPASQIQMQQTGPKTFRVTGLANSWRDHAARFLKDNESAFRMAGVKLPNGPLTITYREKESSPE